MARRQKRQTSTPEQLDDAILGAPLFWSFTKEHWDDPPHHDGSTGWKFRIPPHAVIWAMARETENLRRLVLSMRIRAKEAEHKYDALRRSVLLIQTAQEEATSHDG